MNINQNIIIKDGVFTQKIDDDMVLLDRESENYFGLDEVASRIWKALEETSSLMEVLNILIDEYEVEKKILEHDIIIFVTELEKNGLVKVVEN